MKNDYEKGKTVTEMGKWDVPRKEHHVFGFQPVMFEKASGNPTEKSRRQLGIHN